MKGSSLSQNNLPGDTALLLCLALLKFALHITTAGGYGYFRDELYFIACSDHLDWGFVDQPPLSIFILKIARWLFGDSLYGIRLSSAAAGGVSVFFTGLIARRLGGSRFAQGIAALAFLASPVLLGQHRYFSMNAFDILLWGIALYLMLRIVQEDNHRLWPLLGAVVGLGLQNKYSMGFFCIGVLGGLLLTPYRRHLKTAWFWSGVLIALVVFLPNILWEIKYDYPSYEFMKNRQSGNASGSPLGFLVDQIGEVGRAGFIVWLLGLVYYFIDTDGRRFRMLGWLSLIVVLVMAVTGAKAYYLAPLYPLLLAGGSVYLVKLTQGRWLKWLRAAFAVLIVLIGLIDMPFAIPLLPVETFLRYQEFMGAAPRQDQKEQMGILRQNFADMFGWEEMTSAVASAYRGLTPAEQSVCTIFAWNWGEAGAIDFFGKAYGLPKATCGHNSYWFWGPGKGRGEITIRMGGSMEALKDYYKEVVPAATFTNRYCMPYENNMTIFVCRGRFTPLQNSWSMFRHFE